MRDPPSRLGDGRLGIFQLFIKPSRIRSDDFIDRAFNFHIIFLVGHGIGNIGESCEQGSAIVMIGFVIEMPLSVLGEGIKGIIDGGQRTGISHKQNHSFPRRNLDTVDGDRSTAAAIWLVVYPEACMALIRAAFPDVTVVIARGVACCFKVVLSA